MRFELTRIWGRSWRPPEWRWDPSSVKLSLHHEDLTIPLACHFDAVLSTYLELLPPKSADPTYAGGLPLDICVRQQDENRAGKDLLEIRYRLRSGPDAIFTVHRLDFLKATEDLTVDFARAFHHEGVWVESNPIRYRKKDRLLAMEEEPTPVDPVDEPYPLFLDYDRKYDLLIRQLAPVEAVREEPGIDVEQLFQGGREATRDEQIPDEYLDPTQRAPADRLHGNRWIANEPEPSEDVSGTTPSTEEGPCWEATPDPEVVKMAEEMLEETDFTEDDNNDE